MTATTVSSTARVTAQATSGTMADLGHSRPETPAWGHAAPDARRRTSLGAVVYFSSVSGNTARFLVACRFDAEGLDVFRLPLRRTDPPVHVREPFVLVVPTYGGGSGHRAVPMQVKAFLNDPANRRWIRGVIGSGNANFGQAYCLAADIIAAKCAVPVLYRFELLGTPEDRQAVRRGIPGFLHARATRM